MTRFVTGGAGFIGANFLFYLRERYPDDRLVCIDKLTYAGNLSTLAPLLGQPNFRFAKVDICDREAVYGLFEEEHPDVVVNFAVVGVDLPQNKRGEVALTYVYGIGRSSSAKILDKAGVDRDLKVKDWTDDQAAKIREIIGAEYKVEGDLRSEVQLNIKRLMDIGCYRGVRHRIGLPVRGQSTKNNARTRKGRKKTVANKKKATK